MIAVQPVIRRLPPCRTGWAYAWGAERRAQTSHDIRGVALNAAVTVTWIIGWAVVGLSMTLL